MSTILFVEPSEFAREVYELKFELEGFDVVLAQDGYVAYARALDNHPDLVVIDGGHLPDDVLYFLEKFRGDAEFTAIPVIVFNDHLTTKDIKRLKRFSVCEFVRKLTTTPAELADHVRDILKNKKCPPGMVSDAGERMYAVGA